MDSPSLYERMGGRNGIRAITEKAVANHFSNPVISTRFTNAHMSQKEMVASATEFFCTGLSGVETYEGKSMPDAHAGMNITAAELVAALDDILDAMKSEGLGDLEQAEVLKILYDMKPEILGK
ncbi:group I truncated hemoglobin [Alcanivorax sediminis]|uniref:Group 1 truncated hemoglobin n=1 Tax=Alcanivorax sediminis TaxID=2663008 RepID=A0A6N7LS99_9GAMM|nr:group 1 truncated hemoglobin [Alcanivorax sediminis]MQX52034.1 group 1 truncated hemoglobin [Alcanivorax sediminis]